MANSINHAYHNLFLLLFFAATDHEFNFNTTQFYLARDVAMAVHVHL